MIVAAARTTPTTRSAGNYQPFGMAPWHAVLYLKGKAAARRAGAGGYGMIHDVDSAEYVGSEPEPEKAPGRFDTWLAADRRKLEQVGLERVGKDTEQK